MATPIATAVMMVLTAMNSGIFQTYDSVNHPGYYFDKIDPSITHRVTIPAGIKTRTISIAETSTSKTVTVEFVSNVDFSSSNSCLEFHFDLLSDGVRFDHTIAVPLGQFVYPSTPSISSGNAKIIRDSDKAILGSCSVTISSNQVSVTYPKSIIAENPILTVLRFLPASTPLNSVHDSLNGAPVFYDVHLQRPSGNIFINIPRIPFPQESVPPDFFSSDILCSISNSSYLQEKLMDDDTASDTPGSPVTSIWGPGGGEETIWQPVIHNEDGSLSPPGVIVADLNGNGIPDYILPGHDGIPGTDLMQGYYVIDNLYIVAVVGKDLNNNGQIDRNEVICIIAQCVFASADNLLQIVHTPEGKTLLMWTNINRDNGAHILYVYEPATGILTVTYYAVIDGTLTLMQYDPATRTWVPKPGEFPDPPSWSGSAGGFPWWGSVGGIVLPPSGGGGPDGGLVSTAHNQLRY